MAEPTKEERSELRRLAEAARDAMHPDDWHAKLRLMQSQLHPNTVLALLDALEAREAELAQIRSRDPSDPVNTPGTLSWTREAMRLAGHTCVVTGPLPCQACEEGR